MTQKKKLATKKKKRKKRSHSTYLCKHAIKKKKCKVRGGGVSRVIEMTKDFQITHVTSVFLKTVVPITINNIIFLKMNPKTKLPRRGEIEINTSMKDGGRWA